MSLGSAIGTTFSQKGSSDLEKWMFGVMHSEGLAFLAKIEICADGTFVADANGRFVTIIAGDSNVKDGFLLRGSLLGGVIGRISTGEIFEGMQQR